MPAILDARTQRFLEYMRTIPREMTKVHFRNGKYMEQLGLGIVNTDNPTELENAVDFAIKCGIRVFDCAWIHNHEELIGRVFQDHINSKEYVQERKDIFVITKLWHSFHRKEKVIEQLQETLRKMNLDYVDLYLMHSPMGFKETVPLERTIDLCRPQVQSWEVTAGPSDEENPGPFHAINPALLCQISMPQTPPASPNEPYPAVPQQEPNPAAQQYEPHPAVPQDEPNPAAPQDELNPAAQQHEPNPAVPQDEPNPAAPQDEPNPAVPQDEPNPPVPQDEPNPAVPQDEPNPAAPQDELNPAAQQHEPNPAVPQDEPNPAVPQDEPNPAVAQDEPNPAVPEREPVQDPEMIPEHQPNQAVQNIARIQPPLQSPIVSPSSPIQGGPVHQESRPPPIPPIMPEEISDVHYLETWAAMEECVRMGLAKHIGVANFNEDQLDNLLAHCRIPPEINQIEVHHENYPQAKPFVDYCQGLRRVHVQAHCCLGQNDEFYLPAKIEPTVQNEVIDVLARRNHCGITKEQFVLKFLIEKGLAIVPKTVNIERIMQMRWLYACNLTNHDVHFLEMSELFSEWRNLYTCPGCPVHPHYPFTRRTF